MKRDLRSVARAEYAVEQVLDNYSYEDADTDPGRDAYVDLKSNYQLYKKWQQDEEVDWAVTDDFIEGTVLPTASEVVALLEGDE